MQCEMVHGVWSHRMRARARPCETGEPGNFRVCGNVRACVCVSCLLSASCRRARAHATHLASLVSAMQHEQGLHAAAASMPPPPPARALPHAAAECRTGDAIILRGLHPKPPHALHPPAVHGSVHASASNTSASPAHVLSRAARSPAHSGVEPSSASSERADAAAAASVLVAGLHSPAASSGRDRSGSVHSVGPALRASAYTVSFRRCAQSLMVRGMGVIPVFFAKDRDSTSGIDFEVHVDPAVLHTLGDTRIVLRARVLGEDGGEISCSALTFRDARGTRLASVYPVITPHAPSFCGRVHVWHPEKRSVLGKRRYAMYQLVIEGVYGHADSEFVAFRSEPSFAFVWQVKVSSCTPFAEEYMREAVAVSGGTSSDASSSERDGSAAEEDVGARRHEHSRKRSALAVPGDAPRRSAPEACTSDGAVDVIERVRARLSEIALGTVLNVPAAVHECDFLLAVAQRALVTGHGACVPPAGEDNVAAGIAWPICAPAAAARSWHAQAASSVASVAARV